MRLTLRTLLAYLDDTLEPAQAKAIGAKVAESESALELIERIKQVTRRRRLTPPLATGPSNIDPNTIAEYLDNEVTPEQASEVEQICLSSDVNLAEVAACHQILTLVLGEPPQVPPEASQRMYGLAKGPAAIPFRRLVLVAQKTQPVPHHEGRDLDETLRLGMPQLGRSETWKNRLIVIGGSVAAACMLGIAIWQVLSLPGRDDHNPDKVVHVDPNKDKTKTDKDEPKKDDKKGDDKKKDDKNGEDKKGGDKKDNGDKDTKDKKDKEVGPKDKVNPADVPFGPPSTRQIAVGHVVPPESKEPSLVLQQVADKGEWKRLSAKQGEVFSARPLMSPPGVKSQVHLNKGVRLTLWGTLPETAGFPIYESLVEVYAHEALDVDMALRRGRIMLTSMQERPMLVRLRCENPQGNEQEVFDITLQTKGTSIVIDRLNYFPPTEPFYKNRKNRDRVGPSADMGCTVLKGNVSFKIGAPTYTMTAPPGPAQIVWKSLKGVEETGPRQMNKLPDWIADDPPIPKGMEPRVRKDAMRARDNFVSQLESKAVDVALAESLQSPDANLRRMAVRVSAAVDDLSGLLESLASSTHADLRQAANESLRYWVAQGKDNDYRLFDVLKEKYKTKEAEIIMELMHYLSEKELARAERYELLIDYLVNPNLVIRELGAWHLYIVVPAGRDIPYSASADSAVRAKAEAAWRA